MHPIFEPVSQATHSKRRNQSTLLPEGFWHDALPVRRLTISLCATYRQTSAQLVRPTMWIDEDARLNRRRPDETPYIQSRNFAACLLTICRGAEPCVL